VPIGLIRGSTNFYSAINEPRAVWGREYQRKCAVVRRQPALILGLHQGQATSNITIILTSSTGEERKALRLGADAYLGKPINRSRSRVMLVDEEVSRYLVRQLLPRGGAKV
jgi:hypothetical protein